MLPWSIRPSTNQLSVTYCGCFMMFGLFVGSLGPVIPVKAVEMGIQETDFGIAFMLKGIGGLLASYVAPYVQQRIRLNKCMSLCCGILGLCCATIADTNSMLIFTSAMFVSGITIMFINILGTIALIRTMNKVRTEAWIKGLHSSFGVGAFISPLCMSVMGPSALKLYPVMALLLTILLVFYDHPASERTSSVELETGQEVEAQPKPIPPAFDTAIAVFLFLYAGLEVIYWGWINTFGTQSDGVSTEQSLYGSSIFWVCMTLGRVGTIPLAYVISTSRQLTLLLIGALCSILLCVYFILESQGLYVVIIGSALMGLFCSSMYPLAMNLPNSLGMRTTTSNTSKYAFGGSVGEAVLPFVGAMSISWFGKNAMFGCEIILLIAIIGVYRYALQVAEEQTTPASDIELKLAKGDLYRQLKEQP